MSALMPCTLSAGINETVPTWNEPLPAEMISELAHVGVGSGGELQGRFRVIGGERVDRDRLPLVIAVAPNEADFDRHGRCIAGKPNPPDVLLAFAQTPNCPGRCRPLGHRRAE